MKLILSSCDFINENSKKVIYDNIAKKIEDCRLLFIPNEKATTELLKTDKYYKRLEKDGFTNKKNIYIFDENNSEMFKNLDLDLIYIGGGNTFSTMEKLRKSNFLNCICDYVKKGVIYIGGSCGAHVVTKNIKHVENFDVNEVHLADYNGLGLFNGIIIPHYDASRKEAYERIKSESPFNVYVLSNDDSIVVVNESIEIIRGEEN